MYSAIVSYLHKFLMGYGYSSVTEFLQSLCPSSKYQLQAPTLAVSTFVAFLCHYLGIGFLVCIAMFLAVIVETLSGILASQKRNEPFESFRFSRCVLKVFIWISLVFISNCFYLECAQGLTWMDRMGAWFFDIVKHLILVYFVVEYIVSILENLAVIDGKPKTEFIDVINNLWHAFVKNIEKKGKKKCR